MEIKNTQPQNHHAFPILYTTISIIITAIVVGGGVYLWQTTKIAHLKQQQQQHISTLNAHINDLQQKNSELKTIAEQTPSQETQPTNTNLDLPVIVYERPGLLNNTPEGQAEKKVLETKLVQPFIHYHNDHANQLLTLHISVPEHIGEPYIMTAIYANAGNEGFLFGSREGEYDYWKPTCMGECEFSEEFAKKYPQIIN